jgi:hypothetical protein
MLETFVSLCGEPMRGGIEEDVFFGSYSKYVVAIFRTDFNQRKT